jgi:hypothetical protein
MCLRAGTRTMLRYMTTGAIMCLRAGTLTMLRYMATGGVKLCLYPQTCQLSRIQGHQAGPVGQFTQIAIYSGTLSLHKLISRIEQFLGR